MSYNIIPDPISDGSASIDHDGVDVHVYNDALDKYPGADRELQRITTRLMTGGALFRDCFFGLHKQVARVHPPVEMQPPFDDNQRIMEELLPSPEFEALRANSVNDWMIAVMAAQRVTNAVIDAMDPRHIVNINQRSLLTQEVDRLSRELEVLEDLEETLPEEQKDWARDEQQKTIEKGNHAQKKLDTTAATAFTQEELDAIRRAAKNVAVQAAQDADEEQEAMAVLGPPGDGTGKNLPVDPMIRLNLANQVKKNRQLREVVEKAGRLTKIAAATQDTKVERIPNEVDSIKFSNDVARVLPSEIALLGDPATEVLFDMRYVESQLATYEMIANEKLGRGPVEIVIDESESMTIENRHVWSKAVALAIVGVAHTQKRDVHLISFAFGHQLKEWTILADQRSYAETLIAVATHFWCGGPLRVDQRVVTPDGYKPIGTLQKGDAVIGRDGRPYTVKGVFPQGVLPMNKLTLRDGTSIICDDSHRFHVYFLQGGKSGQILTVAQIKERGVINSSDQYRMRLPVASPIILPEADLPIDPYLMGYMLGNGSLNADTILISSMGDDNEEWAKVLPPGMTIQNYEKRAGFCPNYGIRSFKARDNTLSRVCKDLGLRGTTCASKFIPSSYLHGSISQRWALLQGLLDSDGSSSAPGSAEFSSVSPHLAQGVVWLVQSLGGLAKVAIRETRADRPNERIGYRVGIALDSEEAPFRLKRKASKWRNRGPKRKLVRSIVSIEPVEPAEAVCIAVDSPDHLYLTEGFTPTHNTEYEPWMDMVLSNVTGSRFDRADVILISDGCAYVSAERLARWNTTRKARGMRVYAIMIGGDVTPEYAEHLITPMSDAQVYMNNLEDEAAAANVAFAI